MIVRRGDRVFTGGAEDTPRKGWVVVDVRSLPESPRTVADISRRAVDAKMRSIDAAYERGETVLVRCQVGVSRSPTIAKLYLSGIGKSFSSRRYFPNDQWAAFARANASYYKNREWDD